MENWDVWLYIIMRCLVFTLACLIFLLVFVLVCNLFSQKKALSGLKSKNNFAIRPSFKDWRQFVRKYKNYSILPYLLFIGAFIAGVYYFNFTIMLGSVAFLIWKQISLFWPVTFVFKREGIFFWDPFIMSVRKNFPSQVYWDEVDTIHYDKNTKYLIIKTHYEILYCPMKEDKAKVLSQWLADNFLKRVMSYEFSRECNRGTQFY